jgi:ribonuclease T2
MLSVTRRMTGGVALFLATAVLALWAQGSAPAAARNEAGDFNYYMLVLSWSPTYCESQDDQGRDGGQQCSGSERPWVPNDLITRMLEVMPSRNLVIHEYRTHGVCSGLSPEAYFETARKLYQGVKIPERYAGPGQALTVAPAELVQDFLTANPSLENNMISISCSRNRLRDVRICFTKDLKARACGPSVSRRKSCSQEKVALPPVRGGAGSAR